LQGAGVKQQLERVRDQEQDTRSRTHRQPCEHHRPPAYVIGYGEEQQRDQQSRDADREQQGEPGRREPELGLVDPV
jgi:hypothetical protein